MDVVEQFVLPDSSVAVPSSVTDGSRRRIEIQFTRLGTVTKAQSVLSCFIHI